MRVRIAVLVGVFLAVVPAATLAKVRIVLPFRGPLDAVEISQLVGPSVAYVRTDGGSSGSAVLLADGYLVTSAHVVDPYPAVDLVFSNGRTFASVEVVGVDLAADIAVIGPIRADGLNPLAVAAGDDLTQGESLFLVGYPGESEIEPDQPTITQGILSRVRHVADFDQAYLQTDAAISGGQSGGALVDGRGRVVGVSGLSFAEATFGLALSGADVNESVERIITGDGDDYRSFPEGEGSTEGDVEPDPLESEAVFLLVSGDEDLEVTLEVEPSDASSDAELYLMAYSPFEYLDGDAGELTFEAPADTLIYIQVSSDDERLPAFSYTANVPVVWSSDPDGTRAVHRGDEVRGTVDSLDRSDVYELDLERGEEAYLFLASPHADMEFSVIPPKRSSLDVYGEYADSGLYGSDLESSFTADVGGTYQVVVRSTHVSTGYLFVVE